MEYEIDKKLGIKGPDDVAKMGIAAYNDECRKIVMRYASDWEQIVGRLGRWIGEFEFVVIDDALRCCFKFFRFQKRLQDSLPVVHGVGLVGLQAALY